jgi:hypothetical protein
MFSLKHCVACNEICWNLWKSGKNGHTGLANLEEKSAPCEAGSRVWQVAFNVITWRLHAAIERRESGGRCSSSSTLFLQQYIYAVHMQHRREANLRRFHFLQNFIIFHGQIIIFSIQQLFSWVDYFLVAPPPWKLRPIISIKGRLQPSANAPLIWKYGERALFANAELRPVCLEGVSFLSAAAERNWVNVVRPKESRFSSVPSLLAHAVCCNYCGLYFSGRPFFCNARLNNLGERKDLYLYALGCCCHERFNYSAQEERILWFLLLQLRGELTS